jgi:hypothetical protein
VRSSSRRTLTPAKSLSIKASSTLLSRRLERSIWSAQFGALNLERSMMAVSNGNVLSFATFKLTSPAFVCSRRR